MRITCVWFEFQIQNKLNIKLRYLTALQLQQNYNYVPGIRGEHNKHHLHCCIRRKMKSISLHKIRIIVSFRSQDLPTAI